MALWDQAVSGSEPAGEDNAVPLSTDQISGMLLWNMLKWFHFRNTIGVRWLNGAETA